MLDTPPRQVLAMLARTTSKYEAGPAMEEAVQRLILTNPETKPGPASMRLGQGTWEVS